MRKFGFSILLLLLPFSSSFSRQYDIDYFMECLETGNAETLVTFFDTHSNLVSKTKHLVEFIELVRTNIEKKYGHSPSWEDLHHQFKKLTPSMSFPKENEKEIKDLLKTISHKTKTLEFGTQRVSAFSFDYKGEVDFEEEQTEPVIATTEAIVGVLLLLIDTPYTRGAGTYLLTDSATKYKDHWLQKKSRDNMSLGIDKDYSHIDFLQDDPSCKQTDSFDRNFDSDIR